MSKPTNPQSSSTNAKSMGTIKRREQSKDRNAVGKKPMESVSKTKSIIGKMVKESPTNKTLKTETKVNTTAKTATKPKNNKPETPPSNRVTKTQYFPNKSLYSMALLDKPTTEVPSKNKNPLKSNLSERSKKQAPSPDLVKKRNDIAKTKQPTKTTKETSSKIEEGNEMNERPRTATLKRGSIVNSNIAGPDIPKNDTTTPSLTSSDLSYDGKSNEEDYEDDFDSYESDFEEYHSSDTSLSSTSLNARGRDYEEEATSSSASSSLNNPRQTSSGTADEERMLDSGNFELLPENKQHKQYLGEIKESSNEQDALKDRSSQMGSLSDEGFEEGKSLQNVQFINFIDAQKRWKRNKNVEKRRRRGEEILGMIRLDWFNVVLLDMAPVTYDVFIQSFGNRNSVQVPTQTGDEDCFEGVQTDVIEMTNKWTQFPVTFSKIDQNDQNYLEIYKREFAGVGEDSVIGEKIIHQFSQEQNNEKKLEKFLNSASQIVLTLLDECFYDITENIHRNSREIPFSQGYIKFQTGTHPILKNRPISCVSYYSGSSTKVLTIHARNQSLVIGDSFSMKSVVCIWNLTNTDVPEKMLFVTGDLNFCSFIPEMKNLIFGGLNDGSITIWNLEEGNRIPFIVRNDEQGDNNHYLEPIYMTEIDYGHSSKIISIQPLINTTDNFLINHFEWKTPSNEIWSLDEHGTLIIWSVIRRHSVKSTLPWNNISLVQNSILLLRTLHPNLTDLLCTDVHANVMDPRHLFISTNYGFVLHCLASGAKTNPKKYDPGTQSQATCIEQCPFSPLYFFAGHDDGAVALYSRSLEKPLMVMSNKEDTAVQNGVQLVQWSKHKPCVFYTKDSSNTIHLWDLAISDLYPVYSIPFKENITCMKLSPNMKNSHNSYMILASDEGIIHLHVLNSEYGPTNLNQYQQDVKRFLNYVNRL